MDGQEQRIEVNWKGPFSWPGYEKKNGLQQLPNTSGVYLQSFLFEEGFLIYAAGLTRRSILKRFREHTKKYINGEYNVLDLQFAQKGIRKEIWHGWGYAREHRDEFEFRKKEIIEGVHKELTGFPIFIAELENQPRIHERLEAAIMNQLYQMAPPICLIPDRGMQLSPRWASEEPIFVKNNRLVVLYGLPDDLEI